MTDLTTSNNDTHMDKGGEKQTKTLEPTLIDH